MKMTLHEYESFFMVGATYRVVRVGEFYHTRKCVEVCVNRGEGEMHVGFDVITGGSGSRSANIVEHITEVIACCAKRMTIRFRYGLKPIEYTLIKQPAEAAEL